MGSPSPTTLARSDPEVGLAEGREVVYWDDEITVYKAAGKERLCAEGRHLVVALNQHVEGVYDLVSGPGTRYFQRLILGTLGCANTIPHARYSAEDSPFL